MVAFFATFLLQSIAIAKDVIPTSLAIARVFTSHAVLQRDQPIPVWGIAKPKESVTVTFNGQKKTIKTTPEGKWQVRLDPVPAGGPFKLEVSAAKQSIVLDDILVGEVFLASGQSNMEWRLKQTVNNYKEEIANAKYPDIRYTTITKNYSPKVLTELLDTLAHWQTVSPETASEMSAIAYFFARSLHLDKKIPVGIICDSWGGTVAEAWTSKDALVAMGPDFNEDIKKLEAEGKDLEAYKAKNKQIMNEYIKAMMNADLGKKPENGIYWIDEKYNHQQNPNWTKVTVPGKWEANGLPGYDGIVYYRHNFLVDAVPQQPTVSISLGTVDDVDSVYINGKKVGGGEGWDTPRNYVIPSNVLKKGLNSIAVRILDHTGDGGFTGEAQQLVLKINTNTSIPLAGEWFYRKGTDVATLPPKPSGLKTQNSPTVLFNAMINPVIPYAIKGVIWYQGESNAPSATQYRTLFPTLIKDWRARWGQGDFPFLFVQLANYKPELQDPLESDWAELREAQSMALALPKTGMACTIDIGNANDIHPRNKQDVGARLYLAAKKVVYGLDLLAFGPTYKSVEFQGNKAIVSFDNTGGQPLIVKEKYGYIRGFTIADENHQWHWAKAELKGEKVVVYSDEVAKPVAVRYAWADNPGDLGLYNTINLPMVPFRTDNWKGITK